MVEPIHKKFFINSPLLLSSISFPLIIIHKIPWLGSIIIIAFMILPLVVNIWIRPSTKNHLNSQTMKMSLKTCKRVSLCVFSSSVPAVASILSCWRKIVSRLTNFYFLTKKYFTYTLHIFINKFWLPCHQSNLLGYCERNVQI